MKKRLIDEWQDAPMLWDAIRYVVDNTELKNQYILTGSVTPRKDQPKHTRTGKIVRLLMRPMSLYESGDSTGEVSLKDLFEGVEDITDIRTTSKRCFIDPSIAVASLRATDKDLLKDFRIFGFILESLCLRDLKIYSQNLEGDVFFYRDKNDLESDAVIHLKDGRWGAIEIKIVAE